ncbi:metal ABC transporter substrate-binding protein [uncultured Gimesia sp.]|uniref:metal ABC transporter substrate-binding protein n=1 Tax=uncultured Gimesia sp. TaxID=1678688 RepID=UPI002623FD9B|nr:metal ABC transporter substrate-binding protein [uncultured Gimesia sp.]
MHRIYFIVALFSMTMLYACQQKPQEGTRLAEEKQSPVIVVVNYPLEFIVKSLVGPDVKVLNPVPPGSDPETWFPNDEIIQTIQEADLIVTNGANFADWVKKLSLPRSKVLKTSIFLKEDLITVPDYEVHSHGSGGAHSHAGTVAFFWLDPALLARQADAIGKKLIQLLPREKESITENLKNLKDSLEPLNLKLDQLRSKYPGLHWFSQRPVYQYLTRRADWTVHHLHWKKNTKPNESTWETMKTIQELHKVPFMIWEQKPDKKLLNEFQQRGVSSFVLNPLTAKPARGDYLTEMRLQLNQLEAFLKSGSSTQESSETK